MKLRVERRFLKPDYTVGQLYVDGVFFCDTLEDRVRDLNREKKVAGETAIPAGCYEVVVNWSPRFKRRLPRLLHVPGFEGILIHRGNRAEDTAGCILVGENRVKGAVVQSTGYEIRLTALLEEVQQRGEKIQVEVVNAGE